MHNGTIPILHYYAIKVILSEINHMPYVITQIVITKSVNTFYVTLVRGCTFYFQSAL